MSTLQKATRQLLSWNKLGSKRFFSNPAVASSINELQLPPHVTEIADRVCSLNLIETGQLVKLLKDKLGLPDIVPMASSAPAASGSADASKSNAAAKAPEVEVKTEFNVTLSKFDPASKAKIIREIKAILPNLNLVEAKAFVEGAPKLIKEKVKKDEAEKLKASLEALGATISLE